MATFEEIQKAKILSSYNLFAKPDADIINEVFDLSKSSLNDLEKAKYVDNAENRKKMRVGQEYGGKSEELGKTRSGKTVYSRFNHKDHKGFTKEDHYDASKLQSAKKISIEHKKAKIREEKYGGSWGAADKDEDYSKLHKEASNHSMHERDHLNEYFKRKKEEENKPKKEELSKEEKHAKELQNISSSKIDTLKEFKSYIEDYVDNPEKYGIEIDSDYDKALVWALDNPEKAFELYSK